MAQQLYNPADLPKISGAQIAIVQSKWHREYSDSMVKHCLEVLDSCQCPRPAVHVLPGCLELPLAARRLAKGSDELEAIIAFGIIVKGDTSHFEVVRDECARGLSRVMFECDLPIVNEVLPVYELGQAAARCGDDQYNKGIEAAICAVEVISWRRNNPRLAKSIGF